MQHVITRDELERAGANSYRFEGHRFGDIDVSLYPYFAGKDFPTGAGPRLRRHPYTEVFVVHDGTAIFTVDGRSIEVGGGSIVVAPAGAAHKFVNAGDGPLHLTAIQLSGTMRGEWLEDETPHSPATQSASGAPDQPAGA
jgi:mannose-6-phosphate isomerase-like protein (cupin superfamily)